MTIPELVYALTAAGASAQAISIAVKAVEEAELAILTRRESDRLRKQKSRTNHAPIADKSQVSHVTETRIGHVTEVDPRTPIRERVHPAQNLVSKKQESKNNSSLRSESSTSQNAPIDLLGEIEKFPKAKRTEAVETIRLAGEGWNDLATAFRLPAIDSIKPGSTREKQTLARARDFKADHDLDAGSGFAKLFNLIRGSPYLRGEVNGFSCTFDWVIKPSNFIKIMEGNYEIRQQKGSGFGQRDYRRAG